MRLAKCVGLTAPVTILGSTDAVVLVGPTGQPGDADYHPGWEGDLDQVVGEQDGQPVTLAEALGPQLLQHFDNVNAASPHKTKAPAAPAQE